jgi:hypothetical protein
VLETRLRRAEPSDVASSDRIRFSLATGLATGAFGGLRVLFALFAPLAARRAPAGGLFALDALELTTGAAAGACPLAEEDAVGCGCARRASSTSRRPAAPGPRSRACGAGRLLLLVGQWPLRSVSSRAPPIRVTAAGARNLQDDPRSFPPVACALHRWRGRPTQPSESRCQPPQAPEHRAPACGRGKGSRAPRCCPGARTPCRRPRPRLSPQKSGRARRRREDRRVVGERAAAPVTNHHLPASRLEQAGPLRGRVVEAPPGLPGGGAVSTDRAPRRASPGPASAGSLRQVQIPPSTNAAPAALRSRACAAQTAAPGTTRGRRVALRRVRVQVHLNCRPAARACW